MQDYPADDILHMTGRVAEGGEIYTLARDTLRQSPMQQEPPPANNLSADVVLVRSSRGVKPRPGATCACHADRTDCDVCWMDER
ncbi:hypothetical protein RRG08_017928 [Elysia crispata]|uniref:Uncharacterized protein n=1 Tax=Elysia crispata TaxID=231223 RepID=A0AAE1AA88_9GAST|nr:hypothetical protein RRG08_017928 [Elysia crispata]